MIHTAVHTTSGVATVTCDTILDMTWIPEDSESELYAFEPERFLVPPMEGILRRLFGARWGMILVSAPEMVNLNPVLDFLADYSLQLSYYSQISAEQGDFEALERDKRRIRTIDEILEEAQEAMPATDDELPEVGENEQNVHHVPRNPECVFIPELGPEIVSETVETALSGRLVIAGLRAEGSFPALQTFRSLVGSDHLAAASLMGIVGLNTVVGICPECKVRVEYELDESDAIFLGMEEKNLVGYHGTGCDACGGTGHSGRILIHEGFEVSEKLRTGLLEAMPPRHLRLHAINEGMTTLLDAAWALSEAGETTLEEVIRIAEVTDPGPENGL